MRAHVDPRAQLRATAGTGLARLSILADNFNHRYSYDFQTRLPEQKDFLTLDRTSLSPTDRVGEEGYLYGAGPICKWPRRVEHKHHLGEFLVVSYDVFFCAWICLDNTSTTWSHRDLHRTAIPRTKLFETPKLTHLLPVDRVPQHQPAGCLETHRPASRSSVQLRPLQLLRWEACLGPLLQLRKLRLEGHLGLLQLHLNHKLGGYLAQLRPLRSLKQAACLVPPQQHPSPKLGDSLARRQQHLSLKREACLDRPQLHRNHKQGDYLATQQRHLNHKLVGCLVLLQRPLNHRLVGFSDLHRLGLTRTNQLRLFCKLFDSLLICKTNSKQWRPWGNTESAASAKLAVPISQSSPGSTRFHGAWCQWFRIRGWPNHGSGQESPTTNNTRSQNRCCQSSRHNSF
jgi:hypothetical protein